MGAREAIARAATERKAAAARQQASQHGRVDQLHSDLKARMHAWEAARKESLRLQAALRASREAEAAGERRVSDTLSRLERERMTLSTLQVTQVGATVNSLRKSEAAEIASAAQRIVKGWKAIAGSSGREMDPTSGVVDRSGKRPVPGAGGAVSVGNGGGEMGASSSRSGGGGGGIHTTAQNMRERYAQIDAQKRARQIVQLSAKDVPPAKRPRGH